MVNYRIIRWHELTNELVLSLTASEFIGAIEDELVKFAGRVFMKGNAVYHSAPDTFASLQSGSCESFPNLLGHITNIAYGPSLWREAQQTPDFRVLRPIANIDEIISWSSLEVIRNTYRALRPAFLELQSYLRYIDQEKDSGSTPEQQRYIDDVWKYTEKISMILTYMQVWLSANAECGGSEDYSD